MSDLDEQMLIPAGGEELLEELQLGSATGHRRGPPVQITVVRSLALADLDWVLEPGTELTPQHSLESLRSSHHQLAQLLARGRSQVEASLITGYSQSYISRIVNEDPAFGRLLAHYQAEREDVFRDVLERMKTLGMEVNDLILERIRTDPEKWTNQQLADLHKETVGTLVRGASPAGNGAGVQIGKLEVQFVSPQQKRDEPDGVTIDVTPKPKPRTGSDTVDVEFTDV